jgi:hypothetical protein
MCFFFGSTIPAFWRQSQYFFNPIECENMVFEMQFLAPERLDEFCAQLTFKSLSIIERRTR